MQSERHNLYSAGFAAVFFCVQQFLSAGGDAALAEDPDGNLCQNWDFNLDDVILDAVDDIFVNAHFIGIFI